MSWNAIPSGQRDLKEINQGYQTNPQHHVDAPRLLHPLEEKAAGRLGTDVVKQSAMEPRRVSWQLATERGVAEIPRQRPFVAVAIEAPRCVAPLHVLDNQRVRGENARVRAASDGFFQPLCAGRPMLARQAHEERPNIVTEPPVRQGLLRGHDIVDEQHATCSSGAQAMGSKPVGSHRRAQVILGVLPPRLSPGLMLLRVKVAVLGMHSTGVADNLRCNA
eukprot:CAMPEP_0168358878 /NCGR_PEP_ID=MMETSP0228-20121227/1347_1 /TAXON_ID=133427 /ORGANISM="Protoceratium reticulatum, Strain CCCM 535 (=CCMP 1889)" /LENGTH=219 /DNA_ID=CAMNT_0008371477 /DNA_START=511 /DNA_END=1166 /DNA_ORIENTATION=+